ncbi:hypothetical protein AVEN_21232-1 [Araneus ventricosus]|uniref:Uncharacterized protein n=1 Tax=Araneus ventricosus TaxID=182803 RepID=A0A4Y2LQX9_ARAVE|nr:hypothetical protein AVEN_21232-1 [Araneus ventricosus]
MTKTFELATPVQTFTPCQQEEVRPSTSDYLYLAHERDITLVQSGFEPKALKPTYFPYIGMTQTSTSAANFVTLAQGLPTFCPLPSP